MLKIYGSKNCPDCVNLKRNLDEYHIEYEFIEVLDSLKNLKAFLILRDTHHEVFDRLIAIHDIGLPCCVDEKGNVFTDWETYLKNKGYKILEEEVKSTCSISGKGC